MSCQGAKKVEVKDTIPCTCKHDPQCTICGGSGNQTIITLEDCSHCNGSGEEPEEE